MKLALLGVFALLGGFAGCGSQEHSARLSDQQIASAFKGSPAVLAALHAQGNQLLHGGSGAFHSALERLHGYPVVVNKWASWCGPCRSEFPEFQRLAVQYGRRVAFLGLDAKDEDPAAAAFLRQFRVTYPSFADPQDAIQRGFEVYPQTFYFDRRGKLVYDHAGAYRNSHDLEQDIRRYALQ